MKKEIELIKPHLKKLFDIVFSDNELNSKELRCNFIFHLYAIYKNDIKNEKQLSFEYKEGIEALTDIHELIHTDENKFKDVIHIAYDLYEQGKL